MVLLGKKTSHQRGRHGLAGHQGRRVRARAGSMASRGCPEAGSGSVAACRDPGGGGERRERRWRRPTQHHGGGSARA
ncbi:hypothetical protein E2320_000233 [Naja naja]|nr:hypothetical protein E2320_000233 [Naja naja]